MRHLFVYSLNKRVHRIYIYIYMLILGEVAYVAQ